MPCRLLRLRAPALLSAAALMPCYEMMRDMITLRLVCRHVRCLLSAAADALRHATTTMFSLLFIAMMPLRHTDYFRYSATPMPPTPPCC